MANLRTNNLSGEGGRNAIRGSLFFNSSYPTSSNNGLDSITVPAGSDFAYGTGDFTFEAYVWMSSFANDTRLIYSQTVSGTNYILFGITTSGQVTTILGHSNQVTSTPTIALNSWNHVAVSRSSGTVKVFCNGVASSGSSITTDLNDTTRIPTIGKYTHSTQLAWKGYISNFRITKGEALYTADFTPPTTELTAGDNTVLLCCQDSDNPLQEATGKTITGFGRYADTSVELVSNHSFNNGTTGWTLSDANEGSMTVTNGSLVLTNDDSSDPPVYAWQAVTTVVGQTYELKVHFSGGTGTPGSNLAVYLNNTSSFGSNAGGFMTADSVSGNGIKTMQFTSQYATTYVLVRVNANAAGTSIFSAVSIKAADYGDAPKVIPPYGVDAGNTFGGPIQQSTQGYMYFPTGRTEERGRGRGFVGGGNNAPATANGIQFVEIRTSGNSLDFGDLTYGRQSNLGATGSSTRGIWGGGQIHPANSDVMDFITFATTGNAQDFGNLTVARRNNIGTGNQTRGLFAGGQTPTLQDVIDFVTIASTSDATDFANLSVARKDLGAASSQTRGLFFGGMAPSASDVIDFVTIASASNATDFGNLTAARAFAQGVSNKTRAAMIGGYNGSSTVNTIDFVTIASEGNATDFGDLITAISNSQSASNSIIGLNMGGGNGNTNTIEFITIATTGNGADYGDLYLGQGEGAGCSDSHGGI